MNKHRPFRGPEISSWSLAKANGGSLSHESHELKKNCTSDQTEVPTSWKSRPQGPLPKQVNLAKNPRNHGRGLPFPEGEPHYRKVLQPRGRPLYEVMLLKTVKDTHQKTSTF